MAKLKIVKDGPSQSLVVDGHTLPDVTAFSYETDCELNPKGHLTVTLFVELEDTDTEMGD